MAYTPTGNETTTNGATAVTVVSAPGAGEQIIIPIGSLTVYNIDTATATVFIQKNKNSTISVIEKVEVPVGFTVINSSKVVLDATDETLEVKLNSSVTTTELDIVVAYGVKS